MKLQIGNEPIEPVVSVSLQHASDGDVNVCIAGVPVAFISSGNGQLVTLVLSTAEEDTLRAHGVALNDHGNWRVMD